MRVDYDYWNTLYEYFDKMKLNGKIEHDAKIIQRVQYLWQNASKEYLKNEEAEVLARIWVNVESVVELTTYEDAYKEFISYLFYTSDRMNPNRWLFLQLCISRASDLVYTKYEGCWISEVCNGFYEGYENYFYNIEENCVKEWKKKILPLIKKHRKTRIENQK